MFGVFSLAAGFRLGHQPGCSVPLGTTSSTSAPLIGSVWVHLFGADPRGE